MHWIYNNKNNKREYNVGKFMNNGIHELLFENNANTETCFKMNHAMV